MVTPPKGQADSRPEQSETPGWPGWAVLGLSHRTAVVRGGTQQPTCSMKHRTRLRATTAANYLRTWQYLTSPDHLQPPGTTVGDTPPATQPDRPPTTSLQVAIQPAITEFWASLNPDLEEYDEPPGELHDLFWELRLRTAPWGTDDWEEDDLPASVSTDSSIVDDSSSAAGSVSAPFTPASLTSSDLPSETRPTETKGRRPNL